MTHPYRVSAAPVVRRWGATAWRRFVVRLRHLWEPREARLLKQRIDRILDENWELQQELRREQARVHQLDLTLDDLTKRLRSPQATNQGNEAKEK